MKQEVAKIARHATALLTTIAMAATVSAQVCPQFKNPTSFITGDTLYYWSAKVGERIQPSHSTDTTTGSYIMSSCTFTPTIPDSSITSPLYNSSNSNELQACHEYFFDASRKRFQIITTADSGMDGFTVRDNGTGMPRIPRGYTSSIRLGDMCNSGASHPRDVYNDDTTFSNESSEALFYTMHVTTENALLIIKYAVVARRYSHTAYDAAEFLIRVVAQNDDGTWADEPLNDSLWYKVSAPTFSDDNMPIGWVPGANHGAWPCTYSYKPWSTVGINLNNYLGRNVRIEMYTSDCIYNADPIYAYICGDYSSMSVKATGCPSPESEAIDTLKAPPGMLSYKWYVTTQGAETDIYNNSHMDRVSFRPVTSNGPFDNYLPKVADFVLSAGPNAGDTVGEQTFLCLMTSALDPQKPMLSKMYTNVVFQRPFLDYRTESGCDTTVHFYNLSRSLTDDSLDTNGTYWVIYGDTTYSEVLDTLHSNDAAYHFARPGYYGIKLRCTTTIRPCPAEKRFICEARGGDDLAFSMPEHEICEFEKARATCTEGCNNPKSWIVDGIERGGGNTMEFTLPVGRHNIELASVNAIGCSTRVRDTILVMGEPQVLLSPEDGEICIGDSLLLDVGSNIQYSWSSTPYDSSLPNGYVGSSATVQPLQTTTYTLTPLEETPCFRGNTKATVTVLDYPTLKVETNRPTLSLDNNAVSLTDISPNHTNTTWTFDDSTVAHGSHHTRWYTNLTEVDSVCIGMISCNRYKCCRDTSFCIPVKTFSLWFPNAFTPSLEENNRFKAVCSHELTDYEITIYNRQGILVYLSKDITQGWDGNDLHGSPCPQGAYVYFCRYAMTNNGTYYEVHGTMTLIR